MTVMDIVGSRRRVKARIAVGKDRVNAFWRHEWLEEPKRRKPRGGLSLNDRSCVRLRPTLGCGSYDFVSARMPNGRSVASSFRRRNCPSAGAFPATRSDRTLGHHYLDRRGGCLQTARGYGEVEGGQLPHLSTPLTVAESLTCPAALH